MNDFKKLVRPFETLVFWLVLTLTFHSIVVRAFLVKKFFSGKSPSKTWVRLVRRCVLYAGKYGTYISVVLSNAAKIQNHWKPQVFLKNLKFLWKLAKMLQQKFQTSCLCFDLGTISIAVKVQICKFVDRESLVPTVLGTQLVPILLIISD